MKTKSLPLIEKAAMYCFTILLLLFYSLGAQAQSPMPDVMVTDDLPGLQVQLSGSKSIAVHDDVIYVVWNDNRNGKADNIYFSKSTDGGLSFTPNTCVYYDEDFNHLWPSVAVNDAGTIFVVWSAPMMAETYPTIWFSKSTDGGQMFDDPLELSSGAPAEVFHSLATYGNDVYIFTTGITPADDDMLVDYFFLRSVDGGESFLPAIQVNDQPGVGEDVSIDNTTSMAVDQHGHIYLAWNDGRRAGGNGDIYFAKSTDGGQTFSTNVRVNAAGSAIEDFEICRPAVATDGHGNVYVAFSVEDVTKDEAYLAISTDGGVSFLPEILIEGPVSHVNYFDLMAAPNGTLAIALNTSFDPEGWSTWLITYTPERGGFTDPVALSDVFNHDHSGVQLYYDEEGFAYAVWIDRLYDDKRRLFFARTAEFASAAINPDVFEFEDMFDWFETITGDEIETTITWNDASGVERVYIVIEIMDNGVPEQEVIDLEYRIENDDGVTAQLFMWVSFDKGLRELTKGNSFTMNGYVRFNAGQNAPFFFILLNHPLLAEVYVYDPSTGQGIHEAAVYVQEMDEAFMTYHGEAMIEFPEPGDYHLNITAQGYLPVVDYKITIVEGVFDHLFDIELMPDDTPPHCDPFELPVFENFSDVAPPDLPECWYANVSLGGGVQTVSHPHYSAPASLLMMKAPEDEPYFISPPLDADLGDVRLSFHARTPFLGFGTPTLEIGTMGDPYDTNTFNYIAHVVVPQSPYQEFSVVFAGYEGDHQHIAFRISNQYGEQDIDISIDNILIIENLFALDLVAQPAEGGTVSGAGTYTPGNLVTVSASPNQGFEFQNWRKDGYIIEDVPVFDYTMPAENHTLVAHFIPEGTQTYNLTLEANNPEWGTVTGAGSFVAGETVTVRAIPSAGYVFDHWSDNNDLHETGNPYQFPMPAGDLHLTANFREAVSATINPDTWVFQDFDDFEEGVVTTITWNDAQQVTRVYVVVEDFQYDFYYDVDDIDGITAQLTMYPPAKSLSRNSLFIHGFVEFDVGDPSPITFEFTDPTYYAEVRIREDLYGVGVPNAEIYVQELDITVYTDHNGYAEFRAPAGTYTLDVSAYGFEPLSNQEIELDFDEDYFQFSMTRLEGMFLEVLSSNPAQDDVNVSVFANISIEFDRPIQEGIFGSGFWDIHFEDEYGQFHGFHAVYISDGNILNIDLHHPLEYNTSYYLKIPFYAVADANSPVIFMENNFQLTFRTASDLYPIPLFEDFSGVMPPALPFGWHKNLNLGGEVATTDMFYYSEPYSLVMMKGPNDEPYFVSPALDANLGELRVSFFAKTTYHAYGVPTLEIGTMSDPYNTATFHYIDHVTVPQDGYHELMVSLHSYEGNHAHIAFRLSNYISNQDVDISIDNILIEEAFFSLTLLAYPDEGGTVSGGGDYIAGSQVTVSASPNPGFEFLNWRKDGVIIESAPEFQYTMPPYHHTLSAHFIPAGTPTYDVTLAVNNPDYGYVTGEGTFVEGDYVIVQAFPFAGYIFDHWSDDNDFYEQTNPYVFAMPDDHVHLTANFREVVNATIDPDTWEFDDFEDVPDEIVTTITWNDATDVTRVFVVFDDGMEADFSYRIEDNDGTTATLIMMPPAKSLNQKSFNLAGFVEFDLGAAAPLLFVFEDPSWFFHISIRDEMYNIGIPNAEITIPELDMEFTTNLDGWVNLNLPAGSYTLNVETYGFESVQDVEFEVVDGIMGQELELMMTRKDDMWLQIVSSEPVQNATHVPVTASISITFDRPIQEGYFNNGFQNIFMNDEYGHYFGFQDIYIVEDNVLQFELHEPLQYGTTYWLTIPFYTVADAQSHVIFMEQHFILEFTTVLDSFNDASLSDLTIDGETLEGFSPGVFEYHVELPYNTVDPPVVDATANNPAADVDVVQAAVVTGTATVTVTAEDEVTQLVYTVAFTVAPNDDATLSDLSVNGTTVVGFDPDVLGYMVELPYGTTELPVVDAVATDPNAHVDIVQAAVVTGTATVTVTAEDEVTQLVYTVTFTVAPNDDATLADLSVDGTTLENFDPDVLSYEMELPYGTTDVPVVSATAADVNALVEITQAPDLPGTATVTVTAEDEVTQLVYTVAFTVAPNDDATLADLSVDGATVEGFDPDVLSYEVELPYGTTDIPVVSATAADVNASVEITQAPALPGTAIVQVTAEDGITELTYSVAFILAEPNDDATLADLTVDGTTVEDFDPDVLSYHVVLPPGTTDIPVVDATAADPNAVTQITQAEALPGTATVLVTAEDGVTQLTYTVEFTVSDTSVEEVLNNIGLYPNPATEVLTVEAQAVMNRILMYDMVGNVVLDVPANAMTYEVNVRDLKPGMYFVRIVLDAGTATHKIQVRR